jgi:hypothetical protein
LVSRRLTPPQATPTRHSGEQSGLDEAMSRLAMNGKFPFLDENNPGDYYLGAETRRYLLHYAMHRSKDNVPIPQDFWIS